MYTYDLDLDSNDLDTKTGSRYGKDIPSYHK